MRGRETYECYIEGRGWVRYPVQVPRVRPIRWESPLNPMSAMLDANDYITTVWVGPAAPYPLRPQHIQMPMQMVVRCDWFTATDDNAREYLTAELLNRHPEIATAYLYETVIPDKPQDDCSLIWKVWLHASH